MGLNDRAVYAVYDEATAGWDICRWREDRQLFEVQDGKGVLPKACPHIWLEDPPRAVEEPDPPVPDVAEIIEEWLRGHGYDGLFTDECGCEARDLFPCEACPDECVPGYRVWRYIEGAPEWVIGPTKERKLDPKRAVEIAREILPGKADEWLDMVLWEYTGYPTFFLSEEVLRGQLADFAETLQRDGKPTTDPTD